MSQPLKIFISSPGDVNDERRRAALVVSRLKREFARFFDLSAVLWEYEPMLSSGHFQDIIDPPSTADIVVLILWSRLGTPLPSRTDLREYKSLSGQVPVTGTEWEYEQALDARRQRGVPDLLVYRKFTETQASFTRIEELEDIKRQWEALQSFWYRYFENADGGFKAAFNRFVSLDEFEAQLEQHLRELIRRRLPAQQERLTQPTAGDRIQWWSGSPYRGLQAFDVAQAAIFFGRERAEREITEALVRHAAEGTPFMLVVGPSGSGKSSLVRAGLLPDLMAPGVVGGVSVWRYATIHPADLLPDPAAGLAAILLRPAVLPEIAAVGYQETELAAQLRADITLAAVPLRLALERAAADAGTRMPAGAGKGSLVLVLDQLEVVLANPAFTDEARRTLDRLIVALVQSGLVWVVATLRNDFFHLLHQLPGIQTLAQGAGQYTLGPPSPPEIEQIVVRPAEVAGIAFETEEASGISLAAVIREAAARDPASLPLLSFVLDELYRRDIEELGGKALTYASYHALGSLQGAIARHAERLVESLPDELASALPDLLLAMVELDEFKGTATARTIGIAALADANQQAVADKLVAARLAVADVSGSERTLRLAHEALLKHWPRLAGLLEAHRDFLLIRRRLQSDAAAWKRHDRQGDFLLPPGRRLAEAEEVLAGGRAKLDPDIIGYIEASSLAERARIAAAEAKKEAELRRELQRSRRIAAIVSALLVVAVAAGGFGWWQRQLASAARDDAESSYRLALDQAAGSIQLLTSSHDEGAISNNLMRELTEKAQQTVAGLSRETIDVGVARAQLVDVLALADVSLGDLAAAQRLAEREIGLIDSLSAGATPDLRLQRQWVMAHTRLGEALFWQGDSERALTQLRAAEGRAMTLAVSHPDDELLQRDLMDQYQRLADILRSQGDLDAAAETGRKWIQLAEKEAARAGPDRLKRNGAVALAHQDLGDTLALGENWAAAAVEYRTGVAISDQLLSQEPQNTAYLGIQAQSRMRLGDALLPDNRDAALAEYRTAMKVATRLSNTDPTNFRWRETLEATHQRVGDVLVAQKDFPAALQEFRAYLTLAEEVRPPALGNGSLLYDVSNAQLKLGDALREKGDLVEALAAYRESLEIATELAARNMSTGGWKKILAMTYHRLGLVLTAQGARSDAAAQFRQCLTIPVSKFVWTPRNRWPADVTQACRDELTRLE